MPELHPKCPVCGSNKTHEIMLKGSEIEIPKEFWSSTDYKCDACGSVWITGDYVVRVSPLLNAN
jgi:uncharacterized Zn finger protein